MTSTRTRFATRTLQLGTSRPTPFVRQQQQQQQQQDQAACKLSSHRITTSSAARLSSVFARKSKAVLLLERGSIIRQSQRTKQLHLGSHSRVILGTLCVVVHLSKSSQGLIATSDCVYLSFSARPTSYWLGLCSLSSPKTDSRTHASVATCLDRRVSVVVVEFLHTSL